MAERTHGRPHGMTTIAKALITSGLRAAMEHDPKVVLMGEDIGKLGGVFRVTEGLQKDFGEDRVIDTPLAEAASSAPPSAGPARLPPGGRDPVRRVRLPAFDHIVSRSPRCTPLARARSRCRSSSASRSAAASVRSSTTASQRGLLRAHGGAARRGLLQPARRPLDDPAGHRLPRPGRLLRAQAPLLGQGRGREQVDALDLRRSLPVAGDGSAQGSDVTVAWPTGPWCARACRPRRPSTEEGAASRSSTCARCRRSTSTR
jgi:hypothetical protein